MAHMNQMRTQTSFNREDPSRKIGFGAVPDAKLSSREKAEKFVGYIKRNMQCPTYNLPTIDTVTGHFDGPLSPASVQSIFGATINPLGWEPAAPPAGIAQVDSTFAEPGKFQTFALVCAIQWRLDAEPLSFTAKVNALAPAPTTVVTAPVSPDAIVAQYNGAGLGDDATSGPLGIGAAGGPAAASLVGPATLEWGWWQEMAFFYMSRGYNLVWQYGHNFNLINESLRFTAFTPSGAQDNTGSSSEIDVINFIKRVNLFYRANLAPLAIALPIDRARIGNESLGGTAASSVFRPTRAYETVGATFGGMGLTSKLLKGNGEFRRLTVPFLAWPGVPLGLRAQVSATDDQTQMQNYLDAGQGTGLVPASLPPDANINAGNTVVGAANVTGVEPSIDAGGSVNNSLQLPVSRTIFKGGTFKIAVGFKGFELTPEQASMLGNVDVTRAIQAECGCTLGPAGPMAAMPG